ncbi:hypothetical protein Tco_1091920 [Tanacetum coccineum]|uniref:Uncharacterized protein n=1 Tax=Tanacetum coccineum TaxID=301880 RepID=A0ABQ5IAA4_9ASTR
MSATQTSSQKALTPSLDHFNVVTRICDAVSTHLNGGNSCCEKEKTMEKLVVNGHLLKLGGGRTNCTGCESALENMHYSQMIRFDNAKEARPIASHAVFQVDVSIDRWIVKRLMKLYVDCCNDLFQPPNLILLKKLYKLQVSKDEIDVVDCGLDRWL